MSSMPSMESFLEFAQKKPAEEVYFYAIPQICACGQYAKSIDARYDPMQAIRMVDYSFYPLEVSAAQFPHTWGALTERIREVLKHSQ